MRRNFGIMITILLAIAILIGLSVAGSVELDRPRESEEQPIRSSYSTGPTGTRAFYQLLEESGKPVARWRESYLELKKKAPGVLLIAIGPFQLDRSLPPDEALALQKWAAGGGNVLIISRNPLAQFSDPVIHAEIIAKNPVWHAPPEQLVDKQSDSLIAQPTALTRNLRGLALSTLAARIKFYPPETNADENETAAETAAPTPAASPQPSPTLPPKAESNSEEEFDEMLYAPVIHIGDRDGAILAEFEYGKDLSGRVVFLSDPFVVANNGLARGANLTLALNLIDALSRGENGATRRIYFDEFHHGYRSQGNALIGYFRGTPMPWLALQGLLLSLLLVYTYGRRFARPLPLPQIDRHSPLEFVGSMANLQQTAQARDLALENIYPRFKAQLCRRLGLSSRAQIDEIIAGFRRQRLPISEMELRQALNDGEMVLRGEQVDDAQMVKIVRRMRRILSQIN